MSQTETEWPEGYGPPPDGWEWTPESQVCGHCGATVQVPAQPPAWLDNPAGVVWECSSCSGSNRLGGHDPAVPFDNTAECASCHSTFTGGDGSALQRSDVSPAGAWTCPVCSATNLQSAEGGTTTDTGAAR